MAKIDTSKMTIEEYEAYWKQRREDSMKRAGEHMSKVKPLADKVVVPRVKKQVIPKPTITIAATDKERGLEIYDPSHFPNRDAIERIVLKNLGKKTDTKFLVKGKERTLEQLGVFYKPPSTKTPAKQAAPKPSLAGKGAGEPSKDPYSKGDLTPEQKTARAKSSAISAKTDTKTRTTQKAAEKSNVETKHKQQKASAKDKQPAPTGLPKPRSSKQKIELSQAEIQTRVDAAFKEKPLGAPPRTEKQLKKTLERQIHNDRITAIRSRLDPELKKIIAEGGSKGNKLRVEYSKDAWERAKKAAPSVARKIDQIELDTKGYSPGVKRIVASFQKHIQDTKEAQRLNRKRLDAEKQERRRNDPVYKAKRREQQKRFREEVDAPDRARRSHKFAQAAAQVDKIVRDSGGKIKHHQAMEGKTVEVYVSKTGETKVVPFTAAMYGHGKAVIENPKLRTASQREVAKSGNKIAKSVFGSSKWRPRTPGKHFSEHPTIDWRKGAKKPVLWIKTKMGHFKQGKMIKTDPSTFRSKAGLRKRRSFSIFRTEKTMNIPGKEHIPANLRAGVAMGIKTGMSMNALIKVDSRAIRAALTGPFQTAVKKAIQSASDQVGRKLISLVEPYVPKDQGYMYTSAKVDPHAVQSMMGTAQDMLDPSTEMFGVVISYNTPYAYEVYFGSHRHGSEYNEYYGTVEKGEKETARWIEVAFAKEQAGLRGLLDTYAGKINAALKTASLPGKV